MAAATSSQGALNVKETVVSDGRSTKTCNRGGDDPSNLIEAASVILSATSDDRLDALGTQDVAGRFAVVSEICDEDIRMTARQQLMTDARIKTRNRLIALRRRFRWQALSNARRVGISLQQQL